MGKWAAGEAKAQQQRGVITLEQLDRLGIDWPAVRWAVTSGRLVRMLRCAYRFPVVSPTWEQRALMATLLAGPGSALTHSTAASLWSLSGFEAAQPQRIHLSVPRRRSVQLADDFIIHRPTTTFDGYRLRGLPVTRLARTIVDIAPLVTDERLEIVLDAAQHRHAALPRWLRQELARHGAQTRPGVRRLTELLALREGIATESPLETRVRRAVRDYGLPPPRAQLSVFDARGFVMRVDFAWPQHRVALHVDGFAWHANRLPFDTDAAQRSRLSSLDWASITVTQSALRDDDWLHQLAQTLERRTPQRELFSCDRPRALDRAAGVTPG